MSSLDRKTKNESTSTSTQALTEQSRADLEMGKADILGTINNFNTTNPIKSYEGQMVADLTPDQLMAREQARNLGPATEVQYRTFADFDPETYYNKFEDEVVAATGAYFDEDLAGKISANQARATQSGSYGGSRHGVADAELNRTSLMDKTKMMADLRYKGYDDAANRFERESGALYTKDRDNAVRHDDSVRSNIALLETLGASARDVEQAKLLAERAQYDEKAAEEWKRFGLELQTKIGLFGSTPMLTTQNSSRSSTTKVSDPLGQISQIAGGVGGAFTGVSNFFNAVK